MDKNNFSHVDETLGYGLHMQLFPVSSQILLIPPRGIHGTFEVSLVLVLQQ